MNPSLLNDFIISVNPRSLCYHLPSPQSQIRRARLCTKTLCCSSNNDSDSTARASFEDIRAGLFADAADSQRHDDFSVEWHFEVTRER